MIEPGEDNRRILLAVAAGRVRRARVGAGGPTYLLDGVDGIDYELGQLAADDLVALSRGRGTPKIDPRW